MLICFWLLLLNYILYLHPTCPLNNRIWTEYLFQRYPIPNIQMQISINSICDQPIYPIALQTNNKLALCRLPFTALHRLQIHFLKLWHNIELLPTPFLHTSQGHLLSLPHYLSLYRWTLPNRKHSQSANICQPKPNRNITLYTTKVSPEIC